jgi:hypothetical protein
MDYTQTAKIKSGTIKDALGNVVLTVGGGHMAITMHRIMGQTMETGEAYVIARELVRLYGSNEHVFNMLVEMEDTFVGERGFLYRVEGYCSVTTYDETMQIIDDLDEKGESHFEADGFYKLYISRVIAYPENCGWLYMGRTP